MVPARLRPFDLAETKAMLKFRWQVAGGSQFPFADDAIAEVHRITNGNPCDICKLSDAALLRAFVNERQAVDTETVWTAASEAFVLEGQSDYQ